MSDPDQSVGFGKTRRGAETSALEFVIPGVVHGLGNALFALRGNLYALTPERAEANSAADAMARACDHADQALELLRLLSAPAAEANAPRLLGPLLSTACSYGAIAFRDLGVTLRWEPVSGVDETLVTGGAGLRAVLAALGAVHGLVPQAFDGQIVLRAARWDEAGLGATLSVVAKPEQLPFPVDLTPLLQGGPDAAPWLEAGAEPHSLRIVIER